MQLTLSDQDILAKLRQGETQVFRYCYPRAFPQVKGMVLKNGGSQHDAEDVFQEALIVFYRNTLKDDFELTSALATYLYAISYRLWLKQIRDRKVTTEITESTIGLVEHFDFELAEHQSDRLGEVMNAMETAGKRCKEILIMFYFKKLKFDQIAEQLTMKDERAVREQKYRCMKRIKDTLNSTGNVR